MNQSEMIDFFRKGKKINVYYDSDTDSIYCAYVSMFTLLLGMVFLLDSIYLIFTL